jgi:hypothetical protein
MLHVDPDSRISSALEVRDVVRGCLDVLSPGELDLVYAGDIAALSNLVRAETINLPGQVEAPDGRASATELLDRDEISDEIETGPYGAVSRSEPTHILGGAVRSGSEFDGPTITPDNSTGNWSAVRSTEEALEALSEDLLPVVSTVPLDAAGASIPLVSTVEPRPFEVPFYGRVQELDHLLQRALLGLDGQPTFTVVTGPAGIGKSRLRNELARSLQTAPRPTRVYAARAEENRRLSPYAFLRRMLVNTLEAPDEQRERLLALVPPPDQIRKMLDESDPKPAELTDPASTIGPNRTQFLTGTLIGNKQADALDVDAEEERATVAGFAALALRVQHPELPPVLAVKGNPQQVGEQIRRALDVLLRGLARPSGLIVLVDDAHLLDRPSAEALARLLEPSRALPVSVIAFALPHFVETDHGERSPLGDLEALAGERVELQPLDGRASRELVRALLLRNVESSTLEELVAKGQGHPLFLDQLVRAAQATGALGLGDSGEMKILTEVTDQPDGDRIPPTVAAAVSARVSAMAPQLQKILAAGAVFGEVFWAEGIARVAEQPIERVEQDLERLLITNLVKRRARPRYADQHELEFNHAVIRSVALARLKRTRRHAFEARAASYLLAVGETDRAVIANHTAQTEAPASAAEIYVQAALAALELGDHRSAQRLAEEGLRLVDSPEQGPLQQRLHGVIEQVALVAGDWNLGRDALDALQDLAQNDGERAALLERRSRLAFLSKRFEEARLEAEEARRVWDSEGDQIGVASAELLHGEASEALGDGRAALRSYLSAQARFTAADGTAGLARTGRGLARIALSSGDYGMAENRFRGSLVHARSLRAHEGIFLANLGLAEVARLVGEPSRAQEFLGESRRVAHAFEAQLLVRLHQSWLLLEEQRWDDAYAKIERLLDSIENEARLGGPRRLGALLLALTLRRRPSADKDLRADRDRLNRARSRLERAEANAAAQEPALVISLKLALAHVHALLGDHAWAQSLAEESRSRFEKEGAVIGDEPTGLAYGYARILQLTASSDEQVRAAYAAAVAALDSVGSRLDRKQRQRYLERVLAKSILEEAERAGVRLTRDISSNRITAG